MKSLNSGPHLYFEFEVYRKKIFTRWYFYPSLNTLHYINKQPTPVSEAIAPKVLCLPLYFELEESDQEKISRIINQNL